MIYTEHRVLGQTKIFEIHVGIITARFVAKAHPAIVSDVIAHRIHASSSLATRIRPRNRNGPLHCA